MTQIALTDKEMTVLKAIGDNGLANMGGRVYADLQYDNYSWFNASDIIKITGYSKHQVSGLMSALNEKELIILSDGDWCLSEYGINALVSE